MFFCKSCDSHLSVQVDSIKSDVSCGMHFVCPACSYTEPIKKPIVFTQYFNIKEENNIIDDDTTYGNKCSVNCPKCSHGIALFKEIQTRSADEPMTIFYKCVNCGHNWKQN